MSRPFWHKSLRHRYLKKRLGGPQAPIFCLPRLEALEDRTVLNAVNWINAAGGDWDAAANWVDTSDNSHHVPGPTDDVTINVPGSVTITHSQNVTDSIKSLTAKDIVQLGLGVLNVAGALSSTSTFQMVGGTLGNAIIQAGTTISGSTTGGTLNAVTINGTLDVTGGANHVAITGGLTLDGTMLIGSSTGDLGYVSFNGGTQTLGGTGSIVFGSHPNNTLWTGQSSGTNLTIGPSILIHGQNGNVGVNVQLNGFTDGTFTNQGIIDADVPGGTIKLDGVNWSNSAVSPRGLQAGAGASLTLAGTWNNSGSIVAAASSTLNLSGTVTTAHLGTIASAGASVNIIGTLTNTAATLTLNDTTGSWRLLGGTIDGGTLATTGTNALIATSSGGTLANGVTINGTLDLTTTGGVDHVAITGGLTLDGTMLIGSSTGDLAYVSFNGGNQTLGGTGSIVFGSHPNNTLWTGQSSGTNLTIGPNILIHGQNGNVGVNVQLNGFTDGTFTNQGTIDADVSGGTIKLDGVNWSNSAVSPRGLQAGAGASLTLAGTWNNSGSIVAAASSTLNLSGTVTTAHLGTIAGAGASVNIIGTLTNTAATLTLNDTTGSWRLLGGTIDGGTLATTGTNVLIATSSGGTLANGVTINGTLDLTTAGSANHVAITGGLTLGGTMLIGSSTGDLGYVGFNGGTQTLGGTGTVVFGSSPNNSLWTGQGSGTNLTIGPNILIHGQNGNVGVNVQLNGFTDGTFTNQGTIDADVSGGTIQLNGTNWSNADTGTIKAASGATLGLAGTWTNHGTIAGAATATLNLGSGSAVWANAGTITAAANSTVNLGGTFSAAGLGNLSSNGANVNIVGTLSNAGSTLTLTATSGTWQLLGGTIDGGTLATTAGGALFATNSGGTLANGVTLDGKLDMTSTNGVHVVVTGGLTLGSGVVLPVGSSTGNFAYVSFNGGAQTLSGNGSVLFGSSAANTLWTGQKSGTSLTIGPNILVHGQSGTLGINAGQLGGFLDGTLTNQGTVDADVSGGTLKIDATSWSNASTGLLEAAAGATLTLANAWTNNGAVTGAAGSTLNLGSGSAAWANSGTIAAAANSTANLGGTFSIAALGNFTSNGATVNVVGTLSNTGHTLDLTSTSGTWQLLGGTIDGGVVTTAGTSLIATTSGGTLANGVTLNGSLDVASANGVHVAVTGGLTLGSGVVLAIGSNTGNFGYVSFSGGTQTLSGTGAILFGSSVGNTLWIGQSSGTNLTIGPNIVIHGQNGTLGINTGQLGGFTNGTLTNQGTVDADVPGGTIKIDATNWSNAGTGQLEASGGAALTLANAWTNNGAITGAANATLNLGSTSGAWTNSGAITAAAGAMVNLGGVFSLASLGSFSTAGATVNIIGTLSNAGSTLTLNNTTGSWQLAGGTIDGGTVATTGGSALIATNIGGSLANNVTFNGTLDVTRVSGAHVAVTGGLTLGGTILVGSSTGNFGYVSFNGGQQTLSGNGTILFGSSAGNTLWTGESSGTNVTIGPSILIHGQSGDIGINVGQLGGKVDGTFTIQGTVDVDVSGGTITLNGVNWTNAGTLEAQKGGTILTAGTNTNFAAGALTGGAWNVFANSTLRLVGAAIVTNAANILLDGAGSNFFSDMASTNALAGLATNDASASFRLQNGRNFTTAGPFSNAGSMFIGSGSDFRLASATDYVQTGGDTSVEGVLDSAGGAPTFDLQGGQLDGVGTIGFATINSGGQVNPGMQTPSTPAAPGVLTIAGSFMQGSGGILNVRLAGTGAGAFDQLAVSGNVQLGGVLNATLVNGLVPAQGDSYPVVTFASNTPATDFSSVNLPGLTSLVMEEIRNSASVTLVVSPNIALNPGALPADTINVAYNQIISSTGGNGSKSLVVSNIQNAIAGLSLPATGVDTLNITGTPTATGTEAFTVTATDAHGARAQSSFSITVNPALSLSPANLPQASVAVVYNHTITVSGGTTPYVSLAVSNFSPGSTELTAGVFTTNTAAGTVTINGTPSAPGTATFTIDVTDNAGATLSQNFSLTVFPLIVDAPAVSPTTTSENASTSFTISGTFTDPGGAAEAPYTAVINWGDNTTDTATVSGSGNPFSYSFSGNHRYAQSGNYNATVSVTDKDGGTGTSPAAVVSVANVAPTVSVPTVTPSNANEGSTTSFNVSGTFTDPAGALDEPFTAVINWGDSTTDTATVSGAGNPFSYSFSGNHTYAQSGSYNVTVSVTDKDGGTGTSPAVPVSVANVAPTVSTPTVSPTNTDEGSSTSFSVSGTFTDPAVALDEPFTAVINWGDSTTDTATVTDTDNPFGYSFSGNHTYAQSGSYNVTVSVTDKDGGTGTSPAAAVSVANIAPTVSAPTVSPTNTDEGSSTSFSVSGTFTDPAGALDEPFTAVINWGDNTTDTATVTGAGNPFSYSFSGNHTYAQSGSYDVTMSVTDKDGGTGVSPAVAVSVANVAPTVSTPTVSPTNTNEGLSTSFSVSGTFTDPAGALDAPFTAVINWGDNTTDTATVTGTGNPFSYSFSGNHTYAQSGSYNVTVSVTDKDGGTGTSPAVQVSVAANVATATHFAITAPGNATTGVPFDFTVTALDSHNNVVTGYSGTVRFGSTDNSAGLPADSSLTAGTGTFVATLNRTGNQTITATDTVNGSINGTSGTIAVSGTSTGNKNTFVQQLYVDLLHRPADPQGLQYFTGLLNASAAARVEVVLLIEESPEYRSLVVNDLYQQLLGRSAEPKGLSNWVAFLGAGGTPLQIEAVILGSAEYFAHKGTLTNQGFIHNIYRDVLGRSPDPTGDQFFAQFLANGGSRTAFAELMLQSAESRHVRLKNYYQEFLRRNPDPTGESFWGNLLAQGEPDELVIAGIVGSDEYFAQFHTFPG